ncbi:MAG: hypothetical protein JWM63_4990 [Gammaproteobacteria bacterium]|jgi:hypothetical protein|nr:hypothetical protein [Gammaproteobacteria bacterium]
MKRCYRVFRLFSCSLAFIAVGVAAHAGTGADTEPADWLPHDMLLELRNLPKRYSCNDLWYKFRDVLLEIGARPNMQILTYRCESALGPSARSPRVHLQFETPRALASPQSGEPDISAINRTIRLAAGQPHSLDGADCELLKQMKETLVASLHLRVLDSNLECSAPRNAGHPFSVSIQALVPGEKGARHAALHK